MDSEKVELEGRMIIFLYAPAWIKDEVIGALVRAEYKACHYDDYKSMLKLINLYPGAVVFVNIDKGPKEAEWFRVLSNMQDQLKEKDVRLGVLSDESRKDVVAKWLRGVELPAGFISMRTRQDDIRKRVFESVAREKAIGRRKYARANCRGVGNATLNIKYVGQQYSGSILDISSVGMACKLPQAGDVVSVNDRLDDIQLRLNARLVTVSGHVAGVRQEADKVFVVMFDDIRANSLEEKIYDYIRETIQRNFERRLGQTG